MKTQIKKAKIGEEEENTSRKRPFRASVKTMSRKRRKGEDRDRLSIEDRRNRRNRTTDYNRLIQRRAETLTPNMLHRKSPSH